MKKNREEMKKQLQTTVRELRERGFDLAKEHPLFKWSYPDDPTIEYQLLIVEITPEITVGVAPAVVGRDFSLEKLNTIGLKAH